MSTARAEGCGLVPVASNQRQFDGRVYSPAQCVGQLAENSAAKGNKFNATTFEVTILSQFSSSTRAKDTDVGVPSNTHALKVLDDGVGFLYEEIEDMLSYGTPDSVDTNKKFGSIWHTLLAFGDNFDHEGLYSFRRLAWPATFIGTVEDLTESGFFQCGSEEAYRDMFRADGKSWATLRDLSAAHGHFKEIKETGVLGIFPFGQGSNTLKAEVQDEDIKLQGVSLRELLTKYFVAPALGLLAADYWAEYKGFKMILNVSRRKKIIVEPKAPSFPVSPQITVSIGQAEHAVVYGPYYSPDDQHSLFPYAHDAGQKFHSKKYLFHLASNSRIMNPLHDPKTSDNGNNRADYFARQKVNQKSASSIQKQILETMCGGSMAEETPELFGELQKLLGENGVFDSKNIYLQKSDEFQKQMKNLKWLLGLPFEITARVDTEHLQFNDGKDDLRDDALKRDAFFASVHTAVALDVMKRMLPGLKRLQIEANKVKPEKQLKMDKLFKPGKAQEAPQTSKAASKRKPTVPLKPAPRAAQPEPAQHTVATPAAGRSSKRSAAAAAAAAGAAAGAAGAAAATAGDTCTSLEGRSAGEGDGGRSSRAARQQSRTDQLHPTEMGSPSEARAGKRRRRSTPPDDHNDQFKELDMLAAAAENGIPSQSPSLPGLPTVSRSLLESESEPASKQSMVSGIRLFDDLWRQAVREKKIVHCDLTQNLKTMALALFPQDSNGSA